MYWVRWVTGNEKSLNMRDVSFDTKREALKAISQEKVSSLTKHTESKGRIYVAMLAKK